MAVIIYRCVQCGQSTPCIFMNVVEGEESGGEEDPEGCLFPTVKDAIPVWEAI